MQIKVILVILALLAIWMIGTAIVLKKNAQDITSAATTIFIVCVNQSAPSLRWDIISLQKLKIIQTMVQIRGPTRRHHEMY